MCQIISLLPEGITEIENVTQKRRRTEEELYKRAENSTENIIEVRKSFVLSQEKLLKKQILSDCQVIVGDKGDVVIPVHKAILSANSEVFHVRNNWKIYI